MTLEIEIGGRVRQISVDRLSGAGRVRFTIDGRAMDVDAAETDEDTWSLLLPDGSQHLVSISGSAVSGFSVHVPAGDLAVTVPGLRRGTRRDSSRAAQDHSAPVRIVALMAGKIVRILAVVGQEVRPGQGVVVVEAMKMENELRAPRAGCVKEISVAEGAIVEAGALLAVVD